MGVYRSDVVTSFVYTIGETPQYKPLHRDYSAHLQSCQSAMKGPGLPHSYRQQSEMQREVYGGLVKNGAMLIKSAKHM